MKQNYLRLFSVICLLTIFYSGPLWAAEQITLTTYYPSPFGAYDRMRLVPRSETGIVCDANNVGLMYYDQDLHTLRICRDDGFNNLDWTQGTSPWDQVGDDIFPTDTNTNPNLAVGIGTSTPGSPLHLVSSTITNQNGQSQFYQRANFNQTVAPMVNYAHKIEFPTTQGSASNQYAFGLYVDGMPGVSARTVPLGSSVSSSTGIFSRAQNYGVYGYAHTGVLGDGARDASGIGVVGYQSENDGFAMKAIMTGDNPAFQVEASGILTGPIVRYQHTTSNFSGTGLQMDLAEGSGTFTGSFLDLQKNNVTQVIVKNDGNLGIRRTAPTAKLEVANTGTEDVLRLFDGATEIVTVKDGGNVGIGTATPTAKLHVAGDAKFDGTVTMGALGLGNVRGSLSTDGVPKGSTGGWLVDSGETYVNIMDNFVVRQDAVFADDIYVFDKVDAGQIFTGYLEVDGHEIVKNLMAHTFEMASGAHVTSGGVWADASSRDLKENIQTLSSLDALNTLKGLNPVTYNYKVDKGEQYVGFIAEDVPSLVAQSDRKSLSPMDMVAVLTRVVQDQQKKIEMLEKKVIDLSQGR